MTKRTRNSNPLPKEARPRFETVANRRVTAIVKSIRSLHSIARQRGIKENEYDYQDADVEKIVSYLRDEIDTLEATLKTPPKKEAKEVGNLFA